MLKEITVGPAPLAILTQTGLATGQHGDQQQVMFSNLLGKS